MVNGPGRTAHERSRDAVAGLVLAAGAGRRFGGPKALIELDGELLVSRALRLLSDAGIRRRMVVLGARAEVVREQADLHDAEVVLNASWLAGMGASLRQGLYALAQDPATAAAVILLVDQPLITSAAIGRLVDAYLAGADAAMATYDAEPGNPVLLSRAVWEPAAADAVGDRGARVWLRDNADRVVAVECGDVADPFDIDVPGDLDRLADRTDEGSAED